MITPQRLLRIIPKANLMGGGGISIDSQASMSLRGLRTPQSGYKDARLSVVLYPALSTSPLLSYLRQNFVDPVSIFFFNILTVRDYHIPLTDC